MADRAGPAASILDVLGRAARPVSLPAIAAAARLTADQVASSTAVLVRRGLAERVTADGSPRAPRQAPAYFQATEQGRAGEVAIRTGPTGPHSGRPSPRRGTLRELVWKALRKVRKATVADLVQIAAMGEERAPEQNARKYLQALAAHGYVRVLPRRKGGRKQYLIVQDTGPKAPEWHPASAQLYDPNTGESFVDDNPAEGARKDSRPSVPARAAGAGGGARHG